MKKLISSILVLSLLVVINSLTPVFALKEDVPSKDAEIVALNFISEINSEQWKDINLELKKELYDLEDNHLGYLFYIMKDQVESGYIITSSTFDREPVLEFGETVDEYIRNKVNYSSKAYYLGASQLVFVKNKSELDEIIKLKHGDNQKKIKSITRDKKNKEKWSKLLTNENGTPTAYAATLATNYELAVPRIWQRTSGVDNPGSACGATTAAMISNYLKGIEGHPIKGTAEYGTVDKFIDHLYYELGSTLFGTSMSDWRTGYYTHINHSYTPSGWGVGSMRATDPLGGWAKYKDRISAHRPVALRFDFWTSDGVEANYHFVAGNGIKTVSGIDYFGYKDPDGGQTNTSTHWASWSVNDQDMDMGYPIWNWE